MGTKDFEAHTKNKTRTLMLGGKKKKGKARPVEICSRLGKNQGVFLVLELGLKTLWLVRFGE